MYAMVIVRYRRPIEEVLVHQEAHRAFQRKLKEEGTILAAGPGRILDDGKREAMDVKEGDKVLYAKYAGTEFKADGEDLLIVSQKDVLAIVED